jgi:signal transduction histidine kinase
MIDQPESTQRACSSVSQGNGSTPGADLAAVNVNVSRAEMLPQSVCDHADRLRLWPLLSSSQHVGPGEGQNNEFMTVFSHELRNSLSAIRSAIQILGIQPCDGPPAVKARKMIERQSAALLLRWAPNSPARTPSPNWSPRYCHRPANKLAPSAPI